MAAYTSDANLLIELPNSLPSELSSAVRAQYISDASAEVDAWVGIRFGLSYVSGTQKFPDITASPATPAIIEKQARRLAAALGYRKLGETSRTPTQGTIAEKYEELAWKFLQMIRDGKLDIYDSAGTDLASANPLLSSTTEDLDQDFSRGDYTDGILVSDDAGTLDMF